MDAPQSSHLVPVTSLRLVGGHPALDLVNTLTRRFTESPVEFLRDFDCLIAWGLHAGVLDGREHALCIRAGRSGHAGAGVHARALRLRDALFRLFSERVDCANVSGDAVRVLDSELALAARRWRLSDDGSVVRWRWPADDPALVLARVAVASAELLTSDPPMLVRRCAGAEWGCGWLFVDRSRGARRRWCSMEVCGNRAKARAHHGRARAA